jgi:cell pole-organizing protein PopZ
MTTDPTQTASPDGADPSMEEILASIRRILNEDEAEQTAGTPPPPGEDDVLVLDKSMLVPQLEPEPVVPAPTPVEDLPPPLAPALVAPEAAAAAASSVGNLMRTLAAGRATQVYSGGPTLEDIVRAELRPLMKDWLDTNLPPLVERLVRAEIERVVGRAVP